MDINKWIEHTQRAVKQTGKTFSEIPKTSIIDFLKENGIDDKNIRETIYNELSKINSKTTSGVKESQNKQSETDSKPKKEPRKSVFGEIKRVA